MNLRNGCRVVLRGVDNRPAKRGVVARARAPNAPAVATAHNGHASRGRSISPPGLTISPGGRPLAPWRLHCELASPENDQNLQETITSRAMLGVSVRRRSGVIAKLNHSWPERFDGARRRRRCSPLDRRRDHDIARAARLHPALAWADLRSVPPGGDPTYRGRRAGSPGGDSASAMLRCLADGTATWEWLQ